MIQSGVFCIDKPQGMTSHDVVNTIRRFLRIRQVGHTGTLDPMATGVMLVAVQEATKLVSYLTAQAKRYRATIRLGIATDSYDAEGVITHQQSISNELHKQLQSYAERNESEIVQRALAIERARTEQIPPLFSAIHVDGERAYDKARRGEQLELPARSVSVESLTVFEVQPGEITLEVSCSKGYYVRALARDFAMHLGTVGHLTALRRIQNGPFSIGECARLEEIANDWQKYLIPLRQVGARILPVLKLTEDGVQKVRKGQKVLPQDWVEYAQEGIVLWVNQADETIAIGRLEYNEHQQLYGRVLRGFVAPTGFPI